MMPLKEAIEITDAAFNANTPRLAVVKALREASKRNVNAELELELRATKQALADLQARIERAASALVGGL